MKKDRDPIPRQTAGAKTKGQMCRNADRNFAQGGLTVISGYDGKGEEILEPYGLSLWEVVAELGTAKGSA